MGMICNVAFVVFVFSLCMFVKSFKLIGNEIEDKDESACVRREGINKCLFYGDLVAISGGLIIAKLFFTYLL